MADTRQKVSEKRWTFDRIGSHGNSKSILRFTSPPEVKGVALLVVNHPERASDQWMWTPALERDRRIALQDRSARFFGTDFSFEDLEERDTEQFTYSLLGEEANGWRQACWKLESRPKQTKASQCIRRRNYGFAKITCVDRSASTITRNRMWCGASDYTDVEKYQGNLDAADDRNVTDVAKRTAASVMKIENLKYNLPMQDSDFTVEALRHAR